MNIDLKSTVSKPSAEQAGAGPRRRRTRSNDTLEEKKTALQGRSSTLKNAVRDMKGLQPQSAMTAEESPWKQAGFVFKKDDEVRVVTQMPMSYCRVRVGNERQVRRHLSEDSVSQMANSFRAIGQEAAITGVWDFDNECFWIDTGETRYRAAASLSWESIRAEVAISQGSQAHAWRVSQLVENVTRESLHPLEEAAGLLHAIPEIRTKLGVSFDLTVTQISQYLGKSAKWVSERMHLMELGGDVADIAGLLTTDMDALSNLRRIHKSAPQSAVHIAKHRPELVRRSTMRTLWKGCLTMGNPDFDSLVLDDSIADEHLLSACKIIGEGKASAAEVVQHLKNGMDLKELLISKVPARPLGSVLQSQKLYQLATGRTVKRVLKVVVEWEDGSQSEESPTEIGTSR